MSTDRRRDLLRELVGLRRPLQHVLELLGGFPWDSDEPLVCVHAADVVGVLSRCLEGELSAQQIGDWANALEGRDDLEFEQGGRTSLSEVVFELANPDLVGGLTRTRVAEIVTELSSRGPS